MIAPFGPYKNIKSTFNVQFYCFVPFFQYFLFYFKVKLKKTVFKHPKKLVKSQIKSRKKRYCGRPVNLMIYFGGYNLIIQFHFGQWVLGYLQKHDFSKKILKIKTCRIVQKIFELFFYRWILERKVLPVFLINLVVFCLKFKDI